MNRKAAPVYTNARPAGASDDDWEKSSNDDDEGMDLSGFGPSNPPQKYYVTPAAPVSVPRAEEDWENWEPPAVSEDWGDSPSATIHLACIRGNLDKLKEMLAKEPTYNVNEFFKDTEETPLITACLNGKLNIIEYLVSDGKANPNLRHPFVKQTPLMALVSRYTYSEQEDDTVLTGVTKLIAAGADVNRQDRCGMSCLMVAIKTGKKKLAEHLLEAGADPNLTEQDGRTALFFAVTSADGKMCRRLLECGADVTVEDVNGWGVPELAQDQNLNELSKLLFLVRDTKWRPGLNPQLMTETDEEAVAQRRARVDQVLVMEDSAVEMMLQAVEAEKYLPNFRQHKISYVHFLTLGMEHLEEIGVEEEEVRERILDNIKKTQSVQWQGSSIRILATNKNITAAEAVCLVVNVRDHLHHISSALDYLNGRVQQKPLDLQYDVERNRVEDLKMSGKLAEAQAGVVRQHLIELHRNIGEMQGLTEVQIMKRIPKRGCGNLKNKKSGGKSGRRFVVQVIAEVAVISMAVFLVRKLWRN